MTNLVQDSNAPAKVQQFRNFTAYINLLGGLYASGLNMLTNDVGLINCGTPDTIIRRY